MYYSVAVVAEKVKKKKTGRVISMVLAKMVAAPRKPQAEVTRSCV